MVEKFTKNEIIRSLKNLSGNSFLRAIYKIGLFEAIFYISVFFWILFHKIPEKITIKDIYQIFYIQFLKVPLNNCMIVKMTDTELITRCDNECFILNISLKLGIDTKDSCKKISEGSCKYFLKKLSKKIIFERNYNHIRPKTTTCEEKIILLN